MILGVGRPLPGAGNTFLFSIARFGRLSFSRIDGENTAGHDILMRCDCQKTGGGGGSKIVPGGAGP